MSDVSSVFALITEGAKCLGIASDSEAVKAARTIAIEAVNSGYDAEDAYRFARTALVPGAGVTAA